MGIWIAEKLSFLNVSFYPERKKPSNKIAKLLKGIDTTQISNDKNIYSIVCGDDTTEYPKYIPDKPIMFSYICLSDDNGMSDQQINEKLFYFGKRYKSSYKVPDNIESVIYRPFSNVFWFAGQEGCSCIANPTKDSKQFLNSGMVSKAKTDYFTVVMGIML